MTDMLWPNSGGTPWRDRPYHRAWLLDQANRLFDFHGAAAIDPAGGFFELDYQGRTPAPGAGAPGLLPWATRMVHCYAIAAQLGRPGAGEIVDHGMRHIAERHRDERHGGYFWSADADGPVDGIKQAYGHAFVLLAASSAKLLGHPLAEPMLAHVSETIETRFWEERHGAVAEEFAEDWSDLGPYRGQNSNMHMTEALMAAFEATGERTYLDKAERIAALIIGQHAAGLGYRVAEHFGEGWVLDKEYSGNEMFRPAGTTPGHWLEWSRLCLQLWIEGGRRVAWLKDAATALFRASVELGWDKQHGGFFYTLDWNDAPRSDLKIWWPVCEGIAAAAFLCEHVPDPFHESWYRRIWDFAANHLIDTQDGSWRPELTRDLNVSATLFHGKTDIYHALQACLIPLFPAEGSLSRMIPMSPLARPL